MKTGTQMQRSNENHPSKLDRGGVIKMSCSALKRLQVLPLLFGLLFVSTVGIANAQSTEEKAAMPTTPTPMTREEVKKDRNEFLKTHRWDDEASSWVRKDGKEPTTSTQSRAQVKADRDEFLRNNKYDMNNDAWVVLKGAPRDISKMTREEVKMETREFLRTHRWDDEASKWVEYHPKMKK